MRRRLAGKEKERIESEECAKTSRQRETNESMVVSFFLPKSAIKRVNLRQLRGQQQQQTNTSLGPLIWPLSEQISSLNSPVDHFCGRVDKHSLPVCYCCCALITMIICLLRPSPSSSSSFSLCNNTTLLPLLEVVVVQLLAVVYLQTISSPLLFPSRLSKCCTKRSSSCRRSHCSHRFKSSQVTQ